MKVCEIRDCDRPVRAKGMCAAHYMRVRNGRPVADVPIRPLVKDPTEKFWLLCNRGRDDECWIWSGPRTDSGYGELVADGFRCRAHRFAYELLVGPIPDGLVLDHLCRTRACTNPHHLEPVTNAVNTLRGVGFAAIHARKTHCIHGHQFTAENTIIRSSGARGCRECKRTRDREWWRRKYGAAS